MLTGAYAALEDLLALRLRARLIAPKPTRHRSPNSGERLSRLRGRGVDFAEVRAYQPGDDVRSIDWRVTARMNAPHTKVFREERERPTLICVDQTRSMFFGSRVRLKSVAAAELAARCAWQALASGDRVGGLILGNSDSILAKPKRSSRAVARFLGQLSAANRALNRHTQPVTATRIATELQHLRRLAQTNHRIVVISDFLPAGAFWVETLRALARHNDVIAIQVVDPMEREIPVQEQFIVSDGQQRITFDAADAALRHAYRASFADSQAKLKQALFERGIRFVEVSTDAPLETLDIWH